MAATYPRHLVPTQEQGNSFNKPNAIETEHQRVRSLVMPHIISEKLRQNRLCGDEGTPIGRAGSLAKYKYQFLQSDHHRLMTGDSGAAAPSPCVTTAWRMGRGDGFLAFETH
eukprot:160401-Pleurochrysis_carterae.AAC.1